MDDNYLNGFIIKHKLFHDWGYSVILEKSNHTFSEAHAGSGEIAVVNLVHTILNTEKRSIILLDEPEVSLHPGAQKRLMHFLLKQIKVNHHQVFIATHSPSLIEELPSEAIKKFEKEINSDKILIRDECYPSEAFKYLGSPFAELVVFVEDALAKKILDAVMETNRDKYAGINVQFRPGGESRIKQDIIPLISDYNNYFVIFDGDQKCEEEPWDIKELPECNKNVDVLGAHIKEIVGQHIVFRKDGGDGPPREDQILEQQIKFINFYKNNVFFLPSLIPEDMIWDRQMIMKMKNFNHRELNFIQEGSNTKQYIKRFTEQLTGKSDQNSINTINDILIKNWIEKESTTYEEVISLLDRLLIRLNSRQERGAIVVSGSN
ncbi:hypothetical protein JCM19045_3538 [Bacillus sp. JCM 19045]|nr:hypothetical protein JCM19045_3538 [Bacillus sp. JCM 19045]